jgi:hypothetical protein
MTKGTFWVLSLPVVTALLAALTLGLVLLGRFFGLGTTTFFLLAVPFALAIAYLAWYRTLPYEPAHPVPAAEEEDEESFEDPVEEADRIDSGAEDTETDEAPAGAAEDTDEDEDEGEGEEPVARR